YYPDAFAGALLNSQPMGFYAPAQLVGDARHHGVEVLPADVNFSNWDCTLEPVAGTLRVPSVDSDQASGGRQPPDDVAYPKRSKRPDGVGWVEPCEAHPHATWWASLRSTHPTVLRLGLRMIKGLAEKHARKIIETRGEKPFRPIDDL